MLTATAAIKSLTWIAFVITFGDGPVKDYKAVIPVKSYEECQAMGDLLWDSVQVNHPGSYMECIETDEPLAKPIPKPQLKE